SPIAHCKGLALQFQVCRYPDAHYPQTDKPDIHWRLRSNATTHPLSSRSDSRPSASADLDEPRLFPNDSRRPTITLNARRVSWLNIFLTICQRLSGFCFFACARLLGTAVTRSSSKAGSSVNMTLLRIKKLRVALIASGVFAASTARERSLPPLR